MMNKKHVVTFALCGLLACGTVGGAFALFSGTSDTTENTFTIKAGKAGEADDSKLGQIIEDAWDANKAVNLAPTQIVAKDPKFKSAAQYDCYVIMKVDIPLVNMQLDGGVMEVQDSLILLDSSKSEGNNTGWTLVGTKTGATEHDVTSYYYGYNDTLSTGDTTTTSVFSYVKVPNIVELATNFNDSVDVTATIVQAEGFSGVQEAFNSLNLSVD